MAYCGIVSTLPTIEILGVEYARLSVEDALAEAERLYEQDAPAWIAVENVHGINLAFADPEHQKLLGRADLLLNDGKGVMLGARLQGDRFVQDLHGNRFSPALLRRAAARGWPVFFLGAAPGVARRAADRLMKKIEGLRVTGVRDGYFTEEDIPSLYEEIRASGAGLLFVGMGNPLQEQWLDEHMTACGARLGLTVGAFFDFQSGVVPRAPEWMNRFGFEWTHRLVTDPKRMWRRYLIGNPVFVWRVIRRRVAARRARGAV